jgi:predicted transcriptional regulator
MAKLLNRQERLLQHVVTQAMSRCKDLSNIKKSTSKKTIKIDGKNTEFKRTKHNNRFGQMFDYVYESINPDMLDEEILRIRQCVNEMDNVLSEMDSKDPGAFLSIEKVLGGIIKE